MLFSIADSVQIGKIENYTMIGITSSLLLNITEEQCICQMITSNMFRINYFPTNQTCQLLYGNTSTVVITFNPNASFIFINQSAISITTIQSNGTSNSSVINEHWSFDGDLIDGNSKYNGIAMNNVSFLTPGITGHGAALYFNVSLNQSVMINPTIPLNISFRSFTFEYWIYPFSLATSGGDRGMIGQCQLLTSNKCLHMTIRGSNARISFQNNSCTSPTTILINRWYHLAYVYDSVALTQFIYINGISDCNHTSSFPLQITNLTSSPLTIGVTYPLAPYYFDGLIDELSIVEWAKNSSEILNDATLTAWYSFNGNSYDDAGPNDIDGGGINTTFNNNSLLFNQTKSYFQSSGFVLLGTDNRSYSFSIWINPIQTNNSTILLTYQNSSSNMKWCSAFLGFNSQGKIQAQSRSTAGLTTVTGPLISSYVWTHVVQTYSLTNGISLYINGSLFNKSSSCDYRSSYTPLTMRVGSSFDTAIETCGNVTIQGGQYLGWMDDLRIYSRELTSSDVQTLSIR